MGDFLVKRERERYIKAFFRVLKVISISSGRGFNQKTQLREDPGFFPKLKTDKKPLSFL